MKYFKVFFASTAIFSLVTCFLSPPNELAIRIYFYAVGAAVTCSMISGIERNNQW